MSREDAEQIRAGDPAQSLVWGARVLDARDRMRSLVRRTPVEVVSDLVPGSGVSVLSKLENLQDTGSFKLRGATNKILSLTHDQRDRGVVAASNGNHGLGVAAAAQRARIPAEVYVSSHVSPSKAEGIESYGARLYKVGTEPLEAELAARAAAEASGRVFISPYNDMEVMAGQGSVAVELVEQFPRIDAVFVAVGGGGLIAGIGAYLKWRSPATEVVGCWPLHSAVLYESMRAGRIVSIAEKPTLSESTSGGLEEGTVTLPVCSRVIDRCVLVSEAEILAAMRLVYERKGWLVEGAAGVAIAACLQSIGRYVGKTVVVIVCGGNLSERVRSLL
jgi:threonine dehydratase